jgi:hypothetical protein
MVVFGARCVVRKFICSQCSCANTERHIIKILENVLMTNSSINGNTAVASKLPWRWQDIDFSAANNKLSADDPVMLWLATAASFIESASDIYTQNLVAYFSNDAEISSWLATHWEPEELQHGRALRAYVEAAWPEFDWQKAFDGFLVDYSKLCSTEVLGPTQTLELASRCVIETGTATLYRATRDATIDPVLREIADHIQRDEVRHFKYFFSFFRRYQTAGGASRWAIAKLLMLRVRELRDSDTICALSHIRDGLTDHCNSGSAPQRAPAERNLPDALTMHRLITAQLRPHYPLETAAKMLLAPMALPAIARNIASMTVSVVARTAVRWALR